MPRIKGHLGGVLDRASRDLGFRPSVISDWQVLVPLGLGFLTYKAEVLFLPGRVGSVVVGSDEKLPVA